VSNALNQVLQAHSSACVPLYRSFVFTLCTTPKVSRHAQASVTQVLTGEKLN